MKKASLYHRLTKLFGTPTPRPTTRLRLQTMEDRLAPATLVSPTQVTYTDADGDSVRVTFSKPILTSLTVANSVFKFDVGDVDNGNNAQQQLRELNLTTVAGATGVNVKVELTNKAAGSDGFVNVGHVNALGRDLGTVTIQGDLGRIRAGNDVLTTPALVGLTVNSIGFKGVTTQAPGGTLFTDLVGPVGKIVVTHDVVDANIRINSNNGRLGLLQIGGSLLGGSDYSSGRITALHSIETVRIGDDVVGGSGNASGIIISTKGIGTMTIGGSVYGGSGIQSGVLGTPGNLGSVTVGGDVVGGAGDTSGFIGVSGNVGRITIKGSLLGGTGANSGMLDPRLNVTSITVGGSVVGGAGFGSGRILVGRAVQRMTVDGDLDGRNAGERGGSLYFGNVLERVLVRGNVYGGSKANSGQVYAGRLNSVQIAGSLVGGTGEHAGWLYGGRVGSVKINGLMFGGAIVSEASLGNVFVGAGIIGFPNRRALVIAQTNLASLTVTGSLQHVDVLAGYNSTIFSTPHRNASNVRIGAVNVSGDWIASNLVAGVSGGADGYYGTADDGVLVEGSNGFTSSIGPITIGGIVKGTAAAGDAFGILAEKVTSLKIGGQTVRLKTGALNDATVSLPLNDNTSDFVLKELKA